MATITTNTYLLPHKQRPVLCGVYCVTNRSTGKKYIGQSVNIYKRWEYYYYAGNKDNTPILAAIKKYGIDEFDFRIVEECERAMLNDKEIFWISKEGSCCPNGYNLSTGGRSTTWLYKPSKETLEKRSTALTGQKRSEETKRKMSAAQKGRVLTSGHKNKISLANKGKISSNKGVPMSPSAKEKLSASKSGTKAPWRYVPLIRSDGTTFSCIDEAAKELGANRATIHKHLKGKLKTVHGYTSVKESVSLL